MSRSIVRCFLCKLNSHESQNKESKKKREIVLNALYNLSSLFSLLSPLPPSPGPLDSLFAPINVSQALDTWEHCHLYSSYFIPSPPLPPITLAQSTNQL